MPASTEDLMVSLDHLGQNIEINQSINKSINQYSHCNTMNVSLHAVPTPDTDAVFPNTGYN